MTRMNISQQVTAQNLFNLYIQVSNCITRYVLATYYDRAWPLDPSHRSSSDLFLNRMNMSFGINFKYNVLLHHNIDRLWVVTKVALPKLNNISFPDTAFDPDSPFISNLKHSRTAAQQEEKIKTICRLPKPLITLMKQKKLYYENAITKILKEDILWSFHGPGYSHASSTFQDPASAGQRFSCNTNRERHVCKKKVLSAFLPTITSLAT